MRWDIKHKEEPKPMIIGRKGPNIGDKKEVKKFAWLPVKIDRQKFWLEKYVEIYEFKETKYRQYKFPEHRHTVCNPYELVSINDWVLTKKITYDK